MGWPTVYPLFTLLCLSAGFLASFTNAATAPAKAPAVATVVTKAPVPAKGPTTMAAKTPSTSIDFQAPASCVLTRGKETNTTTKTAHDCAFSCLTDKTCTAITFKGEKVDSVDLPFWDPVIAVYETNKDGLCVIIEDAGNKKVAIGEVSLKTCPLCLDQCNKLGAKKCSGLVHNGLEIEYGAKASECEGSAPAPAPQAKKPTPPAQGPSTKKETAAAPSAGKKAPAEAPKPASKSAPTPAPGPKVSATSGRKMI